MQDISEYVNIFDVHRMEFKYLEFLLDQLNNSVTFHTLINNAKSGANIEHYKKQETNKVIYILYNYIFSKLNLFYNYFRILIHMII